MPIQPNKAIVGANAFAHESGIHQDGMLKNKSTYEIISPEILGLPSKDLVLGKHSGSNAFKSHIDKMIKNTIYADPLTKNPQIYAAMFVSFKKLADAKKSGVTDQDLFAILDDHLNILDSGNAAYEFMDLQLMSGSKILSTATLSVKKEGEVVTDAATGHGPVNAIFNAINRIVGVTNLLASYEVKAVTEGSDSLGTVIVKVQQDLGATHVTKKVKVSKKDAAAVLSNGDVFTGQGTDEDILVASAKAYINAVNRMENAERRMVGSRNVAV